MNHFLIVSILLLQFGCANSLRSSCLNDEMAISTSEANKIAEQYINSRPDKRENYFLHPIIYKGHFVFPNNFCLLKSTALHEGIWVNAKTGQVGDYKEMKIVE